MTRIALTLLSLALLAAPATAAPITTLFSTGLDSNGNPLAAGAADLDYIILETGDPTMVMTNTNYYLPNDAGSQWISETAEGRETYMTRTYQTTFDLTGFDHTSASITGWWAVDNFGDDLLINGISTGYTLPDYLYSNFQTQHALTIASGFQPGINTLEFVVRDVGVRTGLRTYLTGTATPTVVGGVTTVPEPSSLLLLSMGLATVALRRLRR